MSELQLTTRRSSPSAASDVHSEVVNAKRAGVIPVAVFTVTVMVNAVAGIQSVLSAVKGQGEGAPLDGKVFS
jgi:hypothetical protein